MPESRHRREKEGWAVRPMWGPGLNKWPFPSPSPSSGKPKTRPRSISVHLCGPGPGPHPGQLPAELLAAAARGLVGVRPGHHTPLEPQLREPAHVPPAALLDHAGPGLLEDVLEAVISLSPQPSSGVATTTAISPINATWLTSPRECFLMGHAMALCHGSAR